MSEIVLDSSAVLAVIQTEPGAALVENALPGALMSTVNLAEVITKLTMSGVPVMQARRAVEAIGVKIVNFDTEQAELTGGLRPATAKAGLSLGDRACLALSRLRGARVLTMDRSWKRVDGFDVVLIRDRTSSDP
jgi:PIN domain nuclease of toxin-antitoxin system